MDKKDRSEYKYEIYLFSEPYFIYLEDDSIVDINIEDREYDDINSKDKLILEYDDVFFDYNIRNSNRDKFSVTIYSFNRMDQFLKQTDIHGEDMIIKNNSIILNFDQITNNNAWYSVNTNFILAVDVYQRDRISYYRDKKIDKLLN